MRSEIEGMGFFVLFWFGEPPPFKNDTTCLYKDHIDTKDIF